MVLSDVDGREMAGLALRYGPESAETADSWAPLSDAQEAFLLSDEYEVLYGGAKGGAKSESLLMDPLRFTTNSNWRALVLRSTFPELRELLDRAAKYYPQAGGVWEAGNMRYVFPSKAVIEFGYCDRLEHVERYQGREWGGIYYDELGNLASEAVWTRLGAEVRSPDKTLPRRLRASANPGGVGHAWIKRRWITPTNGGKVVYTDPGTGLQRRFIPAKVSDNPVYASDPVYLAQLDALPEQLRRQLRDGDWDAGEGHVLPELSESVHIVPRFDVPPHWVQWGAFDWGYAHPFVCMWFAASESQRVVLIDTVFGRRMTDPEIARYLVERFPGGCLALKECYAGHDCWNEVGARRDGTPSTFEVFLKQGITLVKANIARVAGLRTVREMVAYRNPDGTVRRPQFRMMDTPGNRRVFETLQSMVADPDNLEDALKVDADPQTGVGGDDAYDCLRYGLTHRVSAPTRPEVLPDWEHRDAGIDWERRAVKTWDDVMEERRPRPSGPGGIPQYVVPSTWRGA